ncbi:MAG TPA: helix-turn-helix domain-containing protein [Amycolatopsis sp.]
MAESSAFGAELRRIRAERGISLTGLASLTFYSKGYLSKIETGAKPALPDLAARLDEALGARGLLIELAAAEQRPVCPYLGLTTFSSGDADWFFGREEATGDVLARVADALGNRRPVVVVGPSGVGKSSLVRAGLLPALARDHLPGSAAWPVVVLTPTESPVAELRRHEAGLDGEAERVVIFVDQFEELFTLCESEPERREFIGLLTRKAAEEGALVVLTLRADFYGQCLAHPELLEALELNQVTVGPMSEPQLRSAIEKPAEAAGLTLEPGLIELLLADVGSSTAGALPLLSHALRATWEELEGTVLTVAGYRRTGRIEHAVASTAEKAYGVLEPGERDAAHALLLRLVNVGDHEQDTRRPAQRQSLLHLRPAETGAALEELASERLLTVDADTVTITHDALLHAWPRLRGWIDADRAGLRVHQQLAEATEAWAAEERDPSLLYRGPRLAFASDWARRHENRLNTVERAFLEASEALQETVTRKERRHTRRLRLLVAGLAVLMVLAAVATTIAVYQGNAANHQRDIAVSRQLATEANQLRQNDPSLATQLSLAAYRVADTAEARGSLLSASGTTYVTRFKPHPGTITGLACDAAGRTMITTGLDGTTRFFDVSGPGTPVAHAVVRAGTETVTSLAFAAGTGLLATADEPDATRLWSTRSIDHPALLASLPGAGQPTALALDPAGARLAVGHDDGGIDLWNVADPARPVRLATLVTAGKTIRSLAFAPKAPLLASGGDDLTGRLWDLSGPAPRPESLSVRTAPIRAAAFSPDGTTLGFGSDDRTVDLWTVTDPGHPVAKATLAGHANAIEGLAFSPDGRTVATASDDQTVRLWNSADGTPLTTLSEPAPARMAAFSPDGRSLATGDDLGGLWLWHLPPPVLVEPDGATTVAYDPHRPQFAVGSEDGRVHLWSSTDLHTVGVLAAGDSQINALAYDPRGRVLAAGADDGTIRLWDVSDPAAPRVTATTSGSPKVYTLAYRGDGRVLAATGSDSVVRLWDTTDPARIVPLPSLTGHTNAINGLAFSPDGRLLVTGSDDYSSRVWDVSDLRAPRPLAQLGDHSNAVTSVAFSPDGRTLATASEDHTVHLMDLADPARPSQISSLTASSVPITMAFSPDGRLVATADEDGTAQVWDVTDRGKPLALAVLPGHVKQVTGVAFSPDGAQIATAGEDHTTRLWTVDAAEVADRICALASPPLSADQWAQYVTDLPYRRLCP